MPTPSIVLPCLLVTQDRPPRPTSLVVTVIGHRLVNACHGAPIGLARATPIAGFGRLDGPAILATEEGTGTRALIPAHRLAEIGARV